MKLVLKINFIFMGESPLFNPNLQPAPSEKEAQEAKLERVVQDIRAREKVDEDLNNDDWERFNRGEITMSDRITRRKDREKMRLEDIGYNDLFRRFQDLKSKIG